MSEQNKRALLTDDFGRVARYLRLSVTDRCNLRCVYCQSEVKHSFIPHENVLRYEEMLTVVGAAVSTGIKKIRLTGGEPFARKGFMGFMHMLHHKFPQVDLRITSNGTLLQPHVLALHDLGVRGINISLDSFDKHTFERITRADVFHKVREAIDALLAVGMHVKINAVAMRGVTDKELEKFVDFAMHHPVDVRFIEFMPMGSDTRWSDMYFISADEILKQASHYVELEQDIIAPPVETKNSDYQVYNGPARMYSLKNGLGRLGFITAMSNHFCNTCNRLRVTSDGFVRTCLFADKEYSLTGILRNQRFTNERKEELIHKIIQKSMKTKPLGEALLKARHATAVAKKNMVSIGG